MRQRRPYMAAIACLSGVLAACSCIVVLSARTPIVQMPRNGDLVFEELKIPKAKSFSFIADKPAIRIPITELALKIQQFVAVLEGGDFCGIKRERPSSDWIEGAPETVKRFAARWDFGKTNVGWKNAWDAGNVRQSCQDKICVRDIRHTFSEVFERIVQIDRRVRGQFADEFNESDCDGGSFACYEGVGLHQPNDAQDSSEFFNRLEIPNPRYYHLEWLWHPLKPLFILIGLWIVCMWMLSTRWGILTALGVAFILLISFLVHSTSADSRSENIDVHSIVASRKA